MWIRCREASELASRALDARLPLSRRIALRLHQLVCTNCARFAAQMDEIRGLLRQEQAASDAAGQLSDEARRRIETELHKKLK
jgi:hypothetical protein